METGNALLGLGLFCRVGSSSIGSGALPSLGIHTLIEQTNSSASTQSFNEKPESFSTVSGTVSTVRLSNSELAQPRFLHSKSLFVRWLKKQSSKAPAYTVV